MRSCMFMAGYMCACRLPGIREKYSNLLAKPLKSTHHASKGHLILRNAPQSDRALGGMLKHCGCQLGFRVLKAEIRKNT